MSARARLFARTAAASLDTTRLTHLVRRGYTGCDMLWADFGDTRAKLPMAAVREMLAEHDLGLCVRMPSRPSSGSRDPDDHVANVRD